MDQEGVAILRSKYATITEKKELLQYLESNLEPKDFEKRENGEVFTPVSFVERMLDTFDPLIFSDPNSKFLEPAAGIGNFLVCVYYRLMSGLKEKISDLHHPRKYFVSRCHD